MSNFTGNSEFFSHVEKIDSLNVQIIEKENEIKKIKTETMDDSEISESIFDINSEELDSAIDVDEPLDKADEK